jgi:hypothetical protein
VIVPWGNDRLGQSLPNCDVRVVSFIPLELGSTWLIAGRFSSTPNFKISAIEVSSFAQQMTEEDLIGYWREMGD